MQVKVISKKKTQKERISSLTMSQNLWKNEIENPSGPDAFFAPRLKIEVLISSGEGFF